MKTNTFQVSGNREECEWMRTYSTFRQEF